MPWVPEFPGERPSLGWSIAQLWFELFPSPRNEREPFLLTEQQVLNLVAWYEIHPATGAFVYRRGYSRRSKGTGKSPIEGAKCLTELALPCVFDGWDANGRPVAKPWGTDSLPVPWVQIASLSLDQNENTYAPAYVFLTANDGKLADALNIEPGLAKCVRRDLPGAKLEPVTSRAGSREGQPLIYATIDENGLMTTENGGVRLARTIRRNAAKMGGRVYETGNGFPPGAGTVGESTHKAALAGNSSILYDAAEAPTHLDGVEITADVSDELLRRALEPAYAGCWWVDLDRIVADIRDADMPWADAERYFCNWNRKSEGKAVDSSRWLELADPTRKVAPGSRCGLGFDGSVSDDSTVLIGCTDDGFSFEIGIWERPLDAEGHPVDGWRVPRGEVTERVRWAFSTFDVGRLFADPPGWYTEIDSWAAEFDPSDDPNEARVIALDTNMPRKFSQAVDRWRTGIAEGTHTHDGSDALTRHVEAAVLKPVRVNSDPDDPRTMYVLVKDENKRKIDAAVADVLAFEAAASMPAANPELTPFVQFL